MACSKRSPITFNVKLISGETRTIAADQSEALSAAVSAHGVCPDQNDHFIYYHRNAVVSPYFSIGRLEIEDGDTLVLIEPKENKKQKQMKKSLTSSKSIDNLHSFLNEKTASPPMNYADDFYVLSQSTSNPCFTDRFSNRKTIVPKPPRTISRDPLPMCFQHTAADNDRFWTNLQNSFVQNS